MSISQIFMVSFFIGFIGGLIGSPLWLNLIISGAVCYKMHRDQVRIKQHTLRAIKMNMAQGNIPRSAMYYHQRTHGMNK